MPSVVIAAHDEAAVVGGCLGALLREGFAAAEVVVVANGCTDDTAQRAREFGVIVVERAEPGKAAALNAGDVAVAGYPRTYLDADILLPAGAAAAIHAAFDRSPTPLVVVPRRRVEVVGRPWPVRAYFAVNAALPAFEHGLFGRGVVTVSEEGRARFGRFPELIADDLYLDSLFDSGERAVADFEVVVQAPFRTRDLIRRLVRVRSGNAELRAAAAHGEVRGAVRAADRWAWLQAVAKRPEQWANGIAYATLTLVAAARARAAVSKPVPWGHDRSTRCAGTSGRGDGRT